MMDLGSDWVHRAVTLVLLAMSVGTWVVILWKAWLLRRAQRSLAQATVYPGLALLEGPNVHLKGPSEPPFVRFGAPWIKAQALAARVWKAAQEGLAAASSE